MVALERASRRQTLTWLARVAVTTTLAGLSPARRHHELFGITLAVHRDCGPRPLDLREIVGSQLEIWRADILFEPVQLGGAGDRHHPRPLRQQPSERDLSGR